MGNKNGTNKLRDKDLKKRNNELQVEDIQHQLSGTGRPQTVFVQQPQPMIQHNVLVSGPPDVPISTQPTSAGVLPGNWMKPPDRGLGCPPGLEYFTTMDELFVHQQFIRIHVPKGKRRGFGYQNRFNLKNNLGQDVLYAIEKSNLVLRNCCPSLRPFNTRFYDKFNEEVMHMRRNFACEAFCFPGCQHILTVSAPLGNVIGTINQEWDIIFPHYTIRNIDGEIAMRIKGPFFLCGCCCKDMDFIVTTPEGTQEIGVIKKMWPGFKKEGLTDTDNFKITFPMDMDVKMKTLMLGACLMIEARHFEAAT